MRLIIYSLSALAVLVVAALVGPSFVDWNKYKPQIISQIQNATGLKVTIDGDLGLGILPTPHVTVNDLTIAAPKKIEFDNILVMKSADISVQLMPLLQKQVKIDSVKLVSPQIQIEMMPDGSPSWTIKDTAKLDEVAEAAPEQMVEQPSETKNNALESVSLESLEIENGNFTFIDHRTKARHNAEEINLKLKADSLKGPFDLDGSMKVDGKKIEVDAETGKLPVKDEAMKVIAELSLPEADSKIAFSGVAATKEPYDAQGQTTIKVASPLGLAKMFGASLGGQYDKPLMLDGLLSVNQNNFSYDDMKMSFGNFVGNGKLSVQNLQNKNPVLVTADIQSSSTFDADPFMAAPKESSKEVSESETLKKAGTSAGAKSKDLIPQTLTLPMPIDVDVKLDMGGLKVKGNLVKGVFVDLNKKGPNTKANFKVLETAGQAKADGTLNIAYASSSNSPKSGQVIYADPTVSYAVNGNVGQLEEFFGAFAPKADTSAVTNLYKTAQFNLKGAVSGDKVSLKDSTLKLDQMVVGLGGSYQPARGAGRAKAAIDLTAGDVDFDKILAAKGGKPAASSNDKVASGGVSGSKGNAKEALKPVQNFSLPMDLVFDVSLQKARINNANLEGLRLTGDLVGQKLNLENASVNNFAGAQASLKGQVGDLSKLSGIDLTAYTKTSDLPALASALKVDISKLPKDIKALEASITGKGNVDLLDFNANIKALGGQLDAAGKAANILATPGFDDLSVRVKHPNAVQAIQVVSPDFKGQAGLQQAIDFYTKASSSGKVYTLSDMKVVLGQTNFGGNLKIDTGSKPVSIRGNIQAGQIALDSLLGAKKSSGGPSSAAASSGGSAGASASSAGSSGRWSKTPINLGWMNNVDVDVALAATSITYGAWNFTEPSTDLKIGGGTMNVNGMKAGVFGGQANLSTQVKASPVSVTLSSAMNNIDMEALAKALSGGNKLKSAGRVDFTMDVNSTGESSHALVNALNGKANLNGREVILKGFDLAKLARGLATEEKLATSALSLVDGAMSGGQTKFDTIKGDYKIEAGKIVIQTMVMDGVEAAINSTGYADLPSWFINVDNKIILKNVPDLEPFEVKIKGPLNNPTDTFGKNILEDYIQQKIKRKIGKELGDKLPDVLGKDATDALQKFGILPKQQAPSPAPTPAPANDNNVAPTGETAPATEPEPAPAPAPEQQKDPLQQLLDNPDDPEKAIRGVLEGFMR